MARHQIPTHVTTTLFVLLSVACSAARRSSENASGSAAPSTAKEATPDEEANWLRGVDGNGVDIRPRQLSAKVMVEHAHLSSPKSDSPFEVNEYWITNQNDTDLVLQIPVLAPPHFAEVTLKSRESHPLRYAIFADGYGGHDLKVDFAQGYVTVDQTNLYAPSQAPIAPVSLRKRGEAQIKLRISIFGYSTDLTISWK